MATYRDPHCAPGLPRCWRAFGAWGWAVAVLRQVSGEASPRRFTWDGNPKTKCEGPGEVSAAADLLHPTRGEVTAHGLCFPEAGSQSGHCARPGTVP